MIERIEINLLPAEYRIHKRSLKLSRWTVYPALGLLLLAVGAIFFHIYMLNKVSTLTDEIASLDRQITANKPIQTEINQLRQEKSIIDEKIRALERINVNREKWVRLLEVFSSNLPSYSWLMSVKEEVGPTSILRVEARTYSFPEVAYYMTKLKENEFISEVELHEIEQISSEDLRRVYRYSLSCTVNPDAKLDSIPQQGAR